MNMCKKMFQSRRLKVQFDIKSHLKILVENNIEGTLSSLSLSHII